MSIGGEKVNFQHDEVTPKKSLLTSQKDPHSSPGSASPNALPDRMQ